jgi:hypothetical protein
LSNTGEQEKVPSPPLNEDGNLIVVEGGTKSGTSTAPTVEELMKKLENLNAKLKKLKTKDKKGKKYSSRTEDDDSSYQEEVSNKGKREKKSMVSPPIMLCLLITITCPSLSLILPYPLARLHILMGQTIINGSIA